MEQGPGTAGLVVAILLLALPETAGEKIDRQRSGPTFLTIRTRARRAPRPDPAEWAARLGHRLGGLVDSRESLKVACGKGMVGASDK